MGLPACRGVLERGATTKVVKSLIFRLLEWGGKTFLTYFIQR